MELKIGNASSAGNRDITLENVIMGREEVVLSVVIIIVIHVIDVITTVIVVIVAIHVLTAAAVNAALVVPVVPVPAAPSLLDVEASPPSAAKRNAEVSARDAMTVPAVRILDAIIAAQSVRVVEFIN